MERGMLRVYSIFHSIQGESRYQGTPTVFIRLAGCPVKCLYCDTQAACDSPGRLMSIADAIHRARAFNTSVVEVTGGEPLAQEAAPELLASLVREFNTVLLETSGTFSVGNVDPAVHVVLDVKSPESGARKPFVEDNLDILSGRDHELKFVIASKADFHWAVDFCDKRHLFHRPIAFSPVWGVLSPSTLADWILERRLKVRLGLQLHKVVWPDATEER